MQRQKIGKILFWFGVICVIAWQALTWIQGPTQRIHTAEELSGTVHAIWGPLFWIRMIGGGGLTFSFIGVLLSTSLKGNYSWLLAIPPSLVMSAQYWDPSRHTPALFGIGGTVILLSYFGILWLWTRTHAVYDGLIKTGKLIQLLAYSFLVQAALLLCLYFGNPKVLALADFAIPSGEVINITLSIGMLLLFVSHYLVAQGQKK